MSQGEKIGYLVPQFPGQTHIFFWREIAAMEKNGITPVLFSTRKPPAGLISHEWSTAAMARTTYLGEVSLTSALSVLPRLPWSALWREIRRDGLSVVKDAAICAAAAQALCDHCAEQGISHVHVHSCARAALIAALAQDLGGPSYSLTLHGPLSDYGSAQRYKWRNAKFATVITRKLIAEMQADLPDDLPRLILRPMGVDTDYLRRDTPYVPSEPGGPIRVFSCGRLNVVKGHQDLIEAVRQLRADDHDVTLEIAGQDDDGGSGFRLVLEQLIKQHGLTEHVTLLGAIDAAAVKAKLLEADIFALASWHEPLGVAYMEAIACGVPTIGTNAGGVPELIDDGVEGLLVAPKSPEALSAAILRIHQDPALASRLSETGRARIERDYRASLGAEVIVEEMRRSQG
ncbi:exopolysaccharide biosynthesis GT4 family glycosyltransferase EpsE [Marinovum sp. 2_MG-2023]|uniref:exopolysaccharide biosynthesis GT4 family glycosyltransferase EpsE n=1 Tax=unclassified Marinovum TaxID=2647166 RepID=UPI0026E2E541|nr:MULTISPECIES: exopolysaccharide biosynthesis GT4 family glycosyltransferase EpsE [unclassified Marinovum]MDO6730118.1 exopolysaccharide biosynthesis GT4 family glycosyltransferase EpsE [Marinovum sp. 2_MG-2023]MDO6778856.1 exopolysaccharide biosynthesis GT4 family glycosyltransferase EpsE [Marinovum sp. 1_MG-2023]